MRGATSIFLVVTLPQLVICSLGASPPSLWHIPLVPFHKQRDRRNLLLWSGDEEQNRLSHRRRAFSSAARQVDAAYQGYGTHYVDFWVGTPPQRQTVIIATGNGATGIPCSMCQDCGSGSFHTDAYFDETASETFQVVPCESCTRGRCSRSSLMKSTCKMSMSYQEGSSWHGFEVQDMVYLGGPHDKALTEEEDPASNNNNNTLHHHDDIDPTDADDFRFMMNFACQSSLTGLFKSQMADGILGMENAASSYWRQANKAGVTDARSFALCFARQPTPSRNGTEAGAMTMGGFDIRLHNKNSPVVYAKIRSGMSSSGFFDVTVKGIYLRGGGGGDSALSLNESSVSIVPIELDGDFEAILDSGTTDTYLPTSFGAPIKEQWEKLSGIPFSHRPIDYTEEQLNALPTFLIQLEGEDEMNLKLLSKKDDGSSSSFPLGTLGSAVPDASRPVEAGLDVIVAVPPSHYMEYDDKMGSYVNRFYVDEFSKTATLGANFLMGHDVSFEPDDGRVGFAESNCDYLSLMREFSEPWNNENNNNGGAMGAPSPAPTTLSPTTMSPVPRTPAPTAEASRVIQPDESQGKGQTTTTGGEKVQMGATTLNDGAVVTVTTSWGKVFALLAIVAVVAVPAAMYGKRWVESRYGINIRYQITGIVAPELELQDTSDRMIQQGDAASSYTSPALNNIT